jgi:peroxiredoxin-like protein
MENVHKYRVLAWWASGRNGIAKSESAPNAIHFAAPPQFGGMEGRWTPEHLLLTAIASCFTTTFQAIAEYSKFEYRDLQVEAEGEVRSIAGHGYQFTGIVLRPTISISGEANRDRAVALLNKAKAACMVSKCLATPPQVEATVEVSSEVPVACD